MACHLFPDSIARPQPFNQIHYPTPLLPHSSSLSVSSSPSSTVFSLRFHSLKLFTGCTGRTIAVLNRSIKYGSFCVQPKNAYSADLCLKSVKNFNKAHNGTQINCSGRSCKSVIARSDLVHDGIPDSPNSVAEAQFSAKARGVCFYAVTAINAVFLFVLMLVGHPFVLILDPYRRRFQHLVAKVWASLTIAPFYKVEFVGLEHLPGPDVPSVYVSNHQSFLDIYTLLTLGRSFKFISKTSIFLLPIIGWAMFLMGVIPLKRMDSRSQLECLKRCMDLIKGGASVFFFPEGTRSKDGKLGTFKKGAFSVAAKTGVPVVPITLHGTGNIMPAASDHNLGTSVVMHITPEWENSRAVLFRKCKIKSLNGVRRPVHIGPAVPERRPC